jgi:hypothetical protein
MVYISLSSFIAIFQGPVDDAKAKTIGLPPEEEPTKANAARALPEEEPTKTNTAEAPPKDEPIKANATLPEEEPTKTDIAEAPKDEPIKTNTTRVPPEDESTKADTARVLSEPPTEARSKPMIVSNPRRSVRQGGDLDAGGPSMRGTRSGGRAPNGSVVPQRST